MSASRRGPGPALSFPRWPAEGGCCRSLRPGDRGLGPGSCLRTAGNVCSAPTCTDGPWPGKKTKGTMRQIAASFRIKATGGGQVKPLPLGSRGEAEKNLGATTRALGHSDISDSRASADSLVPGCLVIQRVRRPSAGWPCWARSGNEEGPGFLSALL